MSSYLWFEKSDVKVNDSPYAMLGDKQTHLNIRKVKSELNMNTIVLNIRRYHY